MSIVEQPDGINKWLKKLDKEWDKKILYAKDSSTAIDEVNKYIIQLELEWNSMGYMHFYGYMHYTYQWAYNYHQKTVRCITRTKLLQIKRAKKNAKARNELLKHVDEYWLTKLIMDYCNGDYLTDNA